MEALGLCEVKGSQKSKGQGSNEIDENMGCGVTGSVPSGLLPHGHPASLPARLGPTFFSLSSSRQRPRSRKNLSWKRFPSRRGGSSRHRNRPTRGLSRRIPGHRWAGLGGGSLKEAWEVLG